MPRSSKATKDTQTERQVTVQMYNVGFGDAFLVTFPTVAGPRRVLVDCGVHSAGVGPHQMDEIVAEIIRDVSDGGAPRIDVVVATHRHQDHVSGFSQTLWRDVEVGEVWMPWTEDPNDPDARRIRNTQSRLAAQLNAALGAGSAFAALAANALTNEKAMTTLHRGFAGQPVRRFLPGKDHTPRTWRPDSLPGVTVHLLGPSRDPAIIRDMNPPKHESYLRFADRVAGRSNGLPLFDPRWRCAATALPYAPIEGDTLDQLRGAADPDMTALAVSLEKAVNGTSLMLVFEMGDACLLFPGDAQWGTWRRALDDVEWRELLARTTFYKVGHHGSHNATPVEFVEEVLGTHFSAMAGTKKGMKNWDIPRKALLAALRKKSNRVVRSDEADEPDPADVRRDDRTVTMRIAV